MRHQRPIFALLAILLLACFAAPANAVICRVTPAGSGANNGASWSSPMDLKTALVMASCTEIWVARGVYKPGTGGQTASSFAIDRTLKLYGGFAGTESNRAQRDWTSNLTVLSGDIDNNDNVDANGIGQTVDTAHNAGNSLHVVVIGGTDLYGNGFYERNDTVIDGFVITGGNANASGTNGDTGGGLLCNGDAYLSIGARCSPTLQHLTFSGNNAKYGGAINVNGFTSISSPLLKHVVFSGNRATVSGGATYNDGYWGDSSPTFEFVVFSNNTATYGGAMFNSGVTGASNPTFDSVVFSNNTATYGGAMYNNGSSTGTSSPVLDTVTFNNNSARAIASKLVIGEETVKTHLSSIYRKLGVNDRTGAVATALREGIYR